MTVNELNAWAEESLDFAVDNGLESDSWEQETMDSLEDLEELTDGD